MNDTIAWNLQQGLFERFEVGAIHLTINGARREIEPLGQRHDVDGGNRMALREQVFDGSGSDGSCGAGDADVHFERS